VLRFPHTLARVNAGPIPPPSLYSSALPARSLLLGPLTCMAAAPHAHLGIIDSERPAPRHTHVGGGLHLGHVRRAGARDVEVPLPITCVEACLGIGVVRGVRSPLDTPSQGGQGHGVGDGPVIQGLCRMLGCPGQGLTSTNSSSSQG
jgi:hypothetical protein